MAEERRFSEGAASPEGGRSKKFYIAVDLEGVACVIGTNGQGLRNSPDYPFACRQATKETKAAVDGLFASGADEIIVWDCHGTGWNLDYEMLDPRVKIAMGAGSGKRFPGLDRSFAGILFIGYHAFDAPGAVLSHVYSSAGFSGMFLNGKPAGELQIDAAVAGKNDVPVLFVSSDDICVSQAKASFPDARFVVTKTSLAWNSCVSRHPDAVCEEIRRKSEEIGKDPRGNVYRLEAPFRLDVRFKRMEGAQHSPLTDRSGRPFERTDPYVLSGELDDIETLFRYI